MDKFKRSALAAECAELMREELDKIGGILLIDALLDDYFALKVENNALKVENAELREKAFRFVEDLPGEEWRDIEGYDGRYQVSNLGRVKSFYRKIARILTPAKSYEGYLRVGLYKNGKVERYVAVQRLVAQAFLLNPDNKPFVNHIDGNKLNNCVKNLEWVTQSENVNHAYRIGLSKGPNRKLTDEQVRYIRENHCRLTDRALARMFRVSEGTVRHARVGINYKYVK